MKMKINDLIKTDTVEKWQVCGIVVQCMVSKLGIIQSEPSKLPDTEIHAVNEENGKIVAVMQANSQKELANRMELARDIDGVITVSLVYHQVEDN